MVPVANPAFNPNYYIPENIGVPKQHQKVIGVVDGWEAQGTCMITKEDGVLVVDSVGEDPVILLKSFKPLSGGDWLVRLRMLSNSSGPACI